MEWRESGGMRIGLRQAVVRSLRVPDEHGRSRRLRACTVWKPGAEEFTRTPALARLAKTPDGRIGVLLSGRHQSYVKIGRRFLVTSSLVVPFNMLAKTAAARLLRGTGIALEEIDGVVVAFDPGDRL